MSIVIRKASTKDYEQIADMRNSLMPSMVSGSTGFMGSKISQLSPEELKVRMLQSKVANLISGDAIALIAIGNDKIVGTVDCALKGADTEDCHVYLRNMFVLPQSSEVYSETLIVGQDTSSASAQMSNLSRNCGFARKLLVEASNYATSENAKCLKLDVLRNNHPAISLYTSFGFFEDEKTVVADLFKRFQVGKMIMTKIL